MCGHWKTCSLSWYSISRSPFNTKCKLDFNLTFEKLHPGEPSSGSICCPINSNKKLFMSFISVCAYMYVCVCVWKVHHTISSAQSKINSMQSTFQMAFCEQRKRKLNLSEVPVVGFPGEELFIYLMFFIHRPLSAKKQKQDVFCRVDICWKQLTNHTLIWIVRRELLNYW